MAFNLGDILVTFKSNTDDLKKGLTGVQNMSKGASSAADGITEKFAQAGAASQAFAAGITVVGAAVVGFGVLSVKAFSDSQDRIAQTNAVLQSTGGIAGVTADQVTKLATALESQTKFSDESVRSVENLLLTFTAIGKDIFPQATSTVLDMATALKEDTGSAAIQLGKALQDPILGVTALRRVGVNFNQAQQDVIKNLVETGQSAKAQQLILKELKTEFGGSAKAAGETFSGRLEILKNKLNNVEEAIGGVLIQGVQPLVDAMIVWIDKSGGAEGIMIKLTNALKTIQPYLPAIAGAIIGGLLPAVGSAIGLFALWALTMLPWFALGAAIALIIQHWGDITKVTGNIIAGIRDKFDTLGKLLGSLAGGVFVTVNNVFNDLKKIVEDLAGGGLRIIKDRIKDVGDTFDSIMKYIKDHKKGLEDIATVISILVIPAMIRLNAQAITTAATSAASAVIAGAAWAAQAAVASASWMLQMAIMTPRVIAAAAVSAAQAIVAGAAWTGQAVIAGAAWTLRFGEMIVGAIVTSTVYVAEALIAGAAWIAQFALMAAGAAIAAAGMIASAVIAGIAWVIALGPVTLAIIAIGLAAFLIVRNWSTVQAWFGGLWSWFKTEIGIVGNAIVNVLAGAANAIIAPYRYAFNLIAKLWNNTVGKISFKAPDWVPGMGGKSWGIPQIPAFATGVDNFAGGLAYVHAGEMLVNMAPGTSVIPASKVGGMGGNTFNVTINKDADTDYFFAKFGRNQMLASRGMASQPGSVGA